MLGILRRMKVPTLEEVQDSIEFLRYRDTFSRVMQEILGWPIARGARLVDEWIRDSSFPGAAANPAGLRLGCMPEITGGAGPVSQR